jgi:N-acetylneuraminate synthase
MGQVNIRELAKLGGRFDVEPGLSEHTLGTVASVAAVVLDACRIKMRIIAKPR